MKARALWVSLSLCACVYPKIEVSETADASLGGSGGGSGSGGSSGSAGSAGLTAGSAGVSGAAGAASCLTAVSTGYEHTCAIKDQDVYCWGYNDSGQIGNGGGLPGTNTYAPVQTDVFAVGGSLSLGGEFSCAISSTAGVYCWGNNSVGQLGLSAASNFSTPQWVPGMADVTQIEAGTAHICALVSNHEVWCWGDNQGGAIGAPDGGTFNSPRQVTGFADEVSELAAGNGYNCARSTVGGLWCWGYNTNGQFGNGSYTGTSSPTQVTNISNVAMVAAGGLHTCAIKTDQTLWCWGSNDSGELGTGDTQPSSTPKPTGEFGANVIAVSAGDSHTCAITNDNNLWCWGSNAAKQVGNNSLTDQTSPVNVLSKVIRVSAGGTHTCAITDDGKLYCWGSNNAGQIGIDDNGGGMVGTPTVVGTLTCAG